jgi:hypothetical protein
VVTSTLDYESRSVAGDPEQSLGVLTTEPGSASERARQLLASWASDPRRGGVRHSPLPGFCIGAHAAVTGYRLLTRDASRFCTYFPPVELIAPAQQPLRGPMGGCMPWT